jgi:hypothetical protein
MSEKISFGEWLRKNAEKYLLEAAADEMANLYPNSCARPYRETGVIPFFWRKIFVPIYSKIPWYIRINIIIFCYYPAVKKRPNWKKF